MTRSEAEKFRALIKKSIWKNGPGEPDESHTITGMGQIQKIPGVEDRWSIPIFFNEDTSHGMIPQGLEYALEDAFAKVTGRSGYAQEEALDITWESRATAFGRPL